MRHQTIRIETLIIIVLLFITVVGGGFLLKWAYQSSEILVVNNSPVPARPPEVKDGDKVFLTIDFCKKGDYADKTTLNLVGDAGAKIAVNWPTSRTTEQCTVYKDVPIPIPAQTPSDTYHAEFEVCYDVNFLKKNRCTTFTSQSFKVVNDKLNPGDAIVK